MKETEAKDEPVVEIEFLEWVHPRFGVVPIKKDDGTPVVLRVKIKERRNERS